MRRPTLRFLPAATPALAAALALVVAAFAAEGTAAAQPPATGFALNRYNPSSPGSDWFVLDSLDLRGSGRPALRVGLDWGHQPLVLYDGFDREIARVIERQVFLHFGAAVNIAGRVRLGVNMPLAVNQVVNPQIINGVTYTKAEGTAPGDLRAALDIRLIGEGHGPFTMAIGTEVFFPTGKQDAFLGEGKVRVSPRAAVAGDIGIFAYALQAGFNVRNELNDAQFNNVGQGHEAFGAVAIGLRPSPDVLIGPEVYGSSVVSNANFGVTRATPVEAVLGAHFTLGKDFHLGLGGGPGLTRGTGSPKVRAVATLEYFPAMPPSDRDGDRIIDPDDACPDEPGPRTGDPKTHGCPPPEDRDGDGVIDLEDACPDEPGQRTDDPKTNGCPAPKDRDGDTIMDPEDACPDEPGEKTDDPKTNGCPPPDRDKDKILDREDACPDKPGDKTDDPKTNGCPDTDKDGIFDPEDACPEQPGPKDPDPRKNGCPVARVEKGQVVITQQVKFKTGSHIILPESDYILEAVSKVLTEHPEIKKVRVEGHTDNRGGRAYNRGLSNRRAASVMKWLVNRGGVDSSRLTSQGFGFDRPIATNMTEEGRRENRRVEFHIVDPPPTPEVP